MRKLCSFIVLLCYFCIGLSGQQKVRSMNDGEKRYYYSSVAEAENILLDYIRVNNNMYEFPSKLFIDLILNDDRCYYYDFSRLIEASTSVTIRQLRIKTSDDGKLRLYSWDSDGGTMSCYTGITSYKNDNGIHSYVSPIGEEWYTYNENNPHTRIGAISCGVTRINTIPCNDGSNIYVVFTHSSGSSIMQTMTLDAYKFDSTGPKSCQIFPGDSGYTSSISHNVDQTGIYDKGITLYRNKLIIPETMESENPFGEGRSTGRNLVYLFDGNRFSFDKIEYEKNLYSGLCNYSYNIIVINSGQWKIRLDKMPSGAVRYAASKNRQTNEEPSLVISNGYCASSQLREVTNADMWDAKVTKNEKYIFQNGEYFYEVSWVFDGGFEFTRQHSWKVVVKRFDKILMTLKE